MNSKYSFSYRKRILIESPDSMTALKAALIAVRGEEMAQQTPSNLFSVVFNINTVIDIHNTVRNRTSNEFLKERNLCVV